jgi:hypothetical protein
MTVQLYSKSLYIFATHEEVEAAVCGHLAEAGGCGKVRDWVTDRRFYIRAETCADRLRLHEITALSDPTQGTGACRIAIVALCLGEDEVQSMSLQDFSRFAPVIIDCGGQSADAVQLVFAGVKVDEEINGPLPEGQDPLRVFNSIRKRLLRTKAKGRFFDPRSEKPLRHIHWTEGVRRLHEKGARLYDCGTEIRAVPG